MLERAKFYSRGPSVHRRAAEREGIFGWVVEPGTVRAGDEIRVLELGSGEVHRALSDKPL